MTRYSCLALALCWLAAPAEASLLFADFSTFMDIHLGPAGSVMKISVYGVVCPVAQEMFDYVGNLSGHWCTNPDGSWAPYQSFAPDSELTDFSLLQDSGPAAFVPSGGPVVGPLDAGPGGDPGPGGDGGPSSGGPGGGACDRHGYEYTDPTSNCPLLPGVGGATYDLVASEMIGYQYYDGVAGPNFKIGEVVGTFSTNPSWGDFIGVGNLYSFVVPDGYTDFYLTVNDGYRANNAGAYEVLASPEPGSSALLGSGLIGLAFWLRRGRSRRTSC
jgi:hypothetical protein